MRLLYCGIDVTYLLLGGGSFLPRHCRKALRASTLGTISSSYSQIDKWTTCMTTWTVCWSSSRRGCWFRCWARGRGGWTIRQSGSTRGKICSDNTWRHCSASPIVSLLNYCLSGRDVISDLLVSLISKWPRYSRHCRGALARTAAEVISRKPLVVAYPLICWANVFWVPRAYFLPESQELFSKP